MAPALPDEIKDAFTWRRLRERVSSNVELGDDLTCEALTMIDRLEAALGVAWAQRALGHRRNSSLTESFVNNAPYAIRSMVLTGEAILGLRDLDGWSRVVGRIPTEGEAALAELRVAWRAVRRGMSVSLAPPTDRGRSADALVTMGESGLYVEVFIAEPLPKIAVDIEALEDRIIPRFSPLGIDLTLGGRFLRAPTEPELGPLAEAVETLFKAAHVERGLHQLVVPGLLELRAVLVGDPDHASFLERGLVGNFHGIVFAHSPLGRLISAMRRKSRQLPASGFGLLVITPPHFLGQPPPTTELVGILQGVLAELRTWLRWLCSGGRWWRPP